MYVHMCVHMYPVIALFQYHYYIYMILGNSGTDISISEVYVNLGMRRYGYRLSIYLGTHNFVIEMY